MSKARELAELGAEVTVGTDGSIVFNEDGADQDFRVEGANQPNALFVNAAEDHVSVRSSNFESTSALTVNGNISTIGGISNYGGYKWHSGIDIGTSSGTTDWIMVAPYSVGGTGQPANGIFGKIFITRGNTGTWNDSTVIDVGIKTAWDSTEIPTWIGNETLQLVTYNGIQYAAFAVTGSVRKIFFQGYTVGSFRPFMAWGGSVTYNSDLLSSDNPRINYQEITNRRWEQGSWRPEIRGGGTTVGSQDVGYTLVGNLCHLHGFTTYTDVQGTHGYSSINVTLPFAAKSSIAGASLNSTDIPIPVHGPDVPNNVWEFGYPGISLAQNTTSQPMYVHGAAGVSSSGYFRMNGHHIGTGLSQMVFDFSYIIA